MGGRALSKYGVETERKSTVDFLRIANYFQNKIENDLGLETHIIEFFREKETHGDLDVLIRLDQKVDLLDYIKTNFNPNGLHNNKGVVSFDYENFQIDFIPIRTSIWETAKTFFSFDPTGNIMGKTAHKFGAKYGFDGLVLPVRNDNGGISKNITVSKDLRKIFNFLGYDYDRYLKGFDTKEEIFEWVINSKYFDYRIFQMENLNHIDRKRNKKRATYQEFIKYLSDNNINRTFTFKNKKDHIEDISNFFPELNLEKQLEELNKNHEENKLVNSKFNGHILMNRFEGLKGEKLGHLMGEFKNSFTNFKEYALLNDSETIVNDFEKFIKK